MRENLTHSIRALKLQATLLEQAVSYLLCLWSALLSDSPHHNGGQHSQAARMQLLCLLGRRCHPGCQDPGCYSWELWFTVGTLKSGIF